MLTGSKPFQGEHQAAMTYSIVNEEPEQLETYLPEASEELEQIVAQLLAKDPESRVNSATEANDLLKQIEFSAEQVSQQYTTAKSEAEKTGQESSSSSTTFSITVPDFGFGNKALGKAGLLAGTAVVLTLILAGWWFIGEKGVDQNSEVTPDGNKSNITDRSIAILPFNSVSSSNETLPLAEGLHNDLLTRLANVSDLKVISRTSVEKFKNTNLALPAIADSLGVKWIMEGVVQQMQDKVSINSQLIDPQTDTHIWADTYKRDLTAKDLFAVQGEIAREIAGALHAQLTAGEQKRIADAPTQNFEAYEKYVRARKLLQSVSTEHQYFQVADLISQSLKQDSTFALAWTGLADLIGEGLDDPQMLDSLNLPVVTQKEAVQRALDINPNLPEAHAALGNYYFFELYNIPKAINAYEKAIQLKPSYAEAQQGLGGAYLAIGRLEKALNHLIISEELNPQHVSARHGLHDAYLANGQLQKSLSMAQKQVEMYPDLVLPKWAKMRVFYNMDRFKEAAELGNQILKQHDNEIVPRTYLVAIYAAMGDTSRAKHQLDKLEQMDVPEDRMDLYNALMPTSYAALEKIDAAFASYHKIEEWPWFAALELRYNYFPEARNKLKKDPRHGELIREINQYWGLNPDGSMPKEKETM